MKLEETFMHFLLEHQQEHGRSLSFVVLMESILTAARYIEHYYSRGALLGHLGEAGHSNVQGESVMKLDMLANEIVLHYLRESKQVIEATSEELTEEIMLNEQGRYFVYFDPLDGSSNIRSNLPVGFLFGVARRNLDGPEDFHLRSGREFIAAGMFLIPSGAFTVALRDGGAWRFHLDDSKEYVRPERLTLPTNKKTWELSFNSANRYSFSEKLYKWVAENERKYSYRYVGALAVDVHRLLVNGGMFFYPAILNDPKPEKNRPDGKLRLMYECAVVACIMNEAGGRSIDEHGRDILEIVPFKRHQRSTLFTGSPELVEDIRRLVTGE